MVPSEFRKKSLNCHYTVTCNKLIWVFRWYGPMGVGCACSKRHIVTWDTNFWNTILSCIIIDFIEIYVEKSMLWSRWSISVSCKNFLDNVHRLLKILKSKWISNRCFLTDISSEKRASVIYSREISFRFIIIKILSVVILHNKSWCLAVVRLVICHEPKLFSWRKHIICCSSMDIWYLRC